VLETHVEAGEARGLSAAPSKLSHRRLCDVRPSTPEMTGRLSIQLHKIFPGAHVLARPPGLQPTLLEIGRLACWGTKPV
jgi:hypothetical protein